MVATASRQGTQGPIADAVRHYVAADHTTAVAVVDGAGHEADVVAIAPVLAEVAARNAAQHGAVRGVRSCPGSRPRTAGASFSAKITPGCPG